MFLQSWYSNSLRYFTWTSTIGRSSATHINYDDDNGDDDDDDDDDDCDDNDDNVNSLIPRTNREVMTSVQGVRGFRA